MKKPTAKPSKQAAFSVGYDHGKEPLPFEPEPFLPEIWTPKGHPEAAPMLVCGRRAMLGPVVTGANPERWQYVVHGVAIVIPYRRLPILIHRAECRSAIVWNRQGVITATPGQPTPQNVGMLLVNDGAISKTAAQAALAQAWRCVDCSRDMVTMEPRVAVLETMATAFRGKSTVFRNIVACLSWTWWNEEKLSLEKRAELLCVWGFECTPTALRRMAEECQLSIS